LGSNAQHSDTGGRVSCKRNPRSAPAAKHKLNKNRTTKFYEQNKQNRDIPNLTFAAADLNFGFSAQFGIFK
jgi:hypothetical protein